MPFKKGDPNINRKGRIDGGGLNLTRLLKEKLEKIDPDDKKSYAEKFIEILIKKALKDNDLKSLKLIMNYVDGLPKQTINVNGIINMSEKDREEADELIKKYLNGHSNNIKKQ